MDKPRGRKLKKEQPDIVETPKPPRYVTVYTETEDKTYPVVYAEIALVSRSRDKMIRLDFARQMPRFPYCRTYNKETGEEVKDTGKLENTEIDLIRELLVGVILTESNMDSIVKCYNELKARAEPCCKSS